MLYAVLVIALAIGISAGVWLALGRGPRRVRAYRRARRLVGRGAWAEALALAEAWQANGLPPTWRDHFRAVAGDCHQYIADAAIKDLRFEEGLDHARKAAALLKLDEAEPVERVVDRMLAEARRLFARREIDAVIQLVQRAFAIKTPCPEGSFWLGLCQICKGDTDAALALLTAAHELSGKQFLDTGYYLGLLLHQRGQPQEALRFLAEANRVDGSCPFVTLQMGMSIVAAGGDAGLASRALKRALGPRGLALWLSTPERARFEAFPEGRSYIRRLGEHNAFVCPILGGNLQTILRQGRMSLAEALYRLGSLEEAADVYGQLLQEAPPTLPLLRGLGLSLARLQRYDQAYKHLRTALEEEQSKDPLTAGYLALCGALAKPTKPEDKSKNVTWALRLLARYPLIGNAEWGGLLSTINVEARALGMAVGVEDQVLLCDAFAALNSTNVSAATAYRHLAATFPAAVQPQHAWLFARAAATGAVHGPSDGADTWLFARAFADPGRAKEFFEARGWDLSDAEYAYLVGASAVAPGSFPRELGANYAAHGERFLLERSTRLESAGDASGARTAVEALLKLAPQSARAHDRLACLLHRGGEIERAADLVAGWCRLAPDDYLPFVRLAVLEQERGNAERRSEAIDRALSLTQGRQRAAVAFLGARLALRGYFAASASRSSLNGASGHGHGASNEPSEARNLLEMALHEQPDHAGARWCLTALQSMTSDRDGLAAAAPAMDRADVRDGRFHYMGAVSCLAGGQPGKALELVRRAAFADTTLAGEAYYLLARIHQRQGDDPEAREALEHAAVADGPSSADARTLLGRLYLESDQPGDAVRWWERLDPRERAARGLDDMLRQAAVLAAINDYRSGRFEEAAERFRHAGRLGSREPRIGALLGQSLVQAGRQLLADAEAGE
jgi:tetratricopeptide (TPR) repeat protein